MYRLILVVQVSLLPLGHCFFAQQEELMSSISHQLEDLVNSYVKQSFLKHHFSRNVDDLQLLFGPKQVDSLQVFHDQAERSAAMKVIRGDHGLKLQSSYANNFTGSLLEDDGTFYQWRTYAGLDWDLMKGGVLARKQKLLQLQREYEAEQAAQNERIKDFSYRKSYDFIIYTFNKQKVEVIENRLNILSGLLSVIEKMYYLRYNHWEDVLDIMSKKSETELFLKNYLTYLRSVQLDSQLVNQEVSDLPVFDILFDEIVRQGCDTMTRHFILEKNLEALEHDFHWSKEINLSAQLRYNYYDGGLASSYNARDFLTAGLSLTIPIPFNQSARREWKEAKQQKLRTDFESYRNGLNNELLNHYYEYEYAHKQYLNFFYKKEQLAVTINRGIRKRNLDDPDYSPMQVVDKLDELFSVDLELIDIQQKMYLKALKVFSMVNAVDVTPFIDIKDYNQFVSQYKSRRILFCSADDLRLYEPPFLMEFFRQNGVTEVVVDAGADPSTYLRYAALLDAAVGSDLLVRFAVDPLGGSSQLAPDLQSEISLSLTPSLHFDLNAALKDRHNHYYDEIQETLVLYSKSFDISISVPAHTDPELIQALLPLISKVHLLPEHSEQVNSAFRNLRSMIPGLSNDYVYPGVRPQDFSTKLEFDDFIEEVIAELEVPAVVIDSMDELINLDRKTVGWHEERRF